jgi:hypothetical protein
MKSKPPVLIAALLLTLALLVPATATAAVPGVTVIGEEDITLAVFKKATCKRGRATKGTFYIDATSTNGKYELLAAFAGGFSGFHQYDLTLDPNANPYLRFSEKGEFSSGGYSNEFVPPYPVPGFGAIKFSPDGKRVSLGFGPAMWNRDASKAVVLAGGLECRYPKRKKG